MCVASGAAMGDLAKSVASHICAAAGMNARCHSSGHACPIRARRGSRKPLGDGGRQPELITQAGVFAAQSMTHQQFSSLKTKFRLPKQEHMCFQVALLSSDVQMGFLSCA